MRKLRRRVILIITLAFVVLLFVRSEWMSHWMYPVHFREDIVISADNYKLEPHLVAAIIRVETNYKTGVVSRKGAIGVMQLMPDTANWIIQKGGFGKISTEAISNRADVSIEIGAWYLNALNQQFDGNMYTVIAAYNAGPGNVSRWLADGTWDGKLETVDQVPFGETRHYIQRVIYYYNKYKTLYPNLLVAK
ncbi:lytic transglycosylase domain-containing protein [Paenibacillus sp. DLE-14]|uniref:Lytic transglycosylase domain-containing protein n=2 Tax=Paenibacillus lignilyticus TaxID=1172615 RepID=A0ABS5CE60_9BACL|nr:lytic transglycosylase domain-containing protein [Paenibacillus lignilyticus]MBP3961620.1 lytic transglycosylase domain-containing protein [Paenibacillus lignilyticus]MBP3963710.1 lytic transglycosylase domain-containing protein [Paenibacillus lignilyticus]